MRIRRLLKDWLAIFVATGLLLAAVSHGTEFRNRPITQPRSVEEIKHSGQLLVLTQNNPAVYYIDQSDRESGPEYQLIKSFAKKLGVKPVFIIKSNVVELMDAISRGEGDLATAGLSITRDRQQQVLFGPIYQQVSQQVVCRRNGARPRNVAQLSGVDLEIIAGSSYQERLIKLKKDYPDLDWRISDGLSAEQLLEQIWLKKTQCTVMDSSIVTINQRYFPELRVRFSLGEKDSLAWAMPKGAGDLQRLAFDWFKAFKVKGMARINERYYGQDKLFDYVDTKAFKRRVDTLYPKYQQTFELAAQKHALSATLLAAQSYQESHWKPKAKSPTGVRGMMMLTLSTAKAMGVKNRLKAKQSIYGGAKYLAKLRAQLSDTIQEPDLTWLSLAAYNVGLGHLRDAQKLARLQGKDPHRWHDIKEVLPLLSDKKYYQSLRYGYARGSEPVKYVQQIREYEHILRQQLTEDTSVALY